MSVITLTTDFGSVDPYVGIMKGVILSVAPSAVIVDITHEIAPQNVHAAAYAVYSAYRYFPAGSIHVIVVDPGVGSRRAIIAARVDGHNFLAPDNGILSLVIGAGNVEYVTTVENDGYFLTPVSQTFHGRDIFAPVAGHLSCGLPLDRLGSKMISGQLVRLDLPTPYQARTGEIVGTVTGVDRFGNLITNIDYPVIEKIFGCVNASDLTIKIGTHQISGLSVSYRDAGPEALLAIVGSMGFIEISVNCGNASLLCGASAGSRLSITAVGGN